MWTALVQPYSEYGDYWAIVPAFLMMPIAIILHILIAYKEKWKLFYAAYGAVHIVIMFFIWIKCLMLISKDSF